MLGRQVEEAREYIEELSEWKGEALHLGGELLGITSEMLRSGIYTGTSLDYATSAMAEVMQHIEACILQVEAEIRRHQR